MKINVPSYDSHITDYMLEIIYCDNFIAKLRVLINRCVLLRPAAFLCVCNEVGGSAQTEPQ